MAAREMAPFLDGLFSRFESARRLCTIGFILTLCQRAGHGRLRVSFPGDPREEL